MRQYFLQYVTNQQLTVTFVEIHIGNKGDIHGSLKHCNSKTSKNPWKIWKIWPLTFDIWHMTFERPTVLQNLLLLQIYTYVQWISGIIQNTHVQKIRSFFVLMEWLHLPHG